ncbi:MAG: FAD-dependent oxidoreductase [Xanthomonadales bacterium]|nr:FAD-dependent oxidoreductase [Xanthomonadales bacterium]
MTKRRKNAGGYALAAADRITPSYRPKQAEKAAPCQAGCVNCGDIRAWIGTVAQRGKTGLSREQAFSEAWRILVDVNPFPGSLGRICPHPCEDRCNRRENDQPLAINAMERFLGDWGIRANLPLPRLEHDSRSEWVGVIGAGPSGLSFAYQMARRGYRVTVYEGHPRAGGMLRYGVPDYRLPQKVLDAEIEKILALGVDLRLDTRVGRDVSLETLRARHEVLYLGIGAQSGRTLGVPGEQGPGVLNGADYLARINAGEQVDLGKRVVVVGGGNTAMDAARCARRAAPEVTVLYRRTRAEMPALAHEIDDALEEGVVLMELAAPMKIRRGKYDRLTGVRVQEMELAAPDDSGRRRPVPVAGSGFVLAADSVIVAVSQQPSLQGFEALNHDGNWLVTGPDGAVGEGILSGGDVRGPGIAGNAIVQGRRAAELLHGRLTGSLAETPELRTMAAREILFETKPSSEAAHSWKRPALERLAGGLAETSDTISEAEFLAEAERCYSCGSCSGCEQCFMYCTSGCFTKLEEAGPGTYFTLNLDACQECGKCVEVCPCGFLEFS